MITFSTMAMNMIDFETCRDHLPNLPNKVFCTTPADPDLNFDDAMEPMDKGGRLKIYSLFQPVQTMCPVSQISALVSPSRIQNDIILCRIGEEEV